MKNFEKLLEEYEYDDFMEKEMKEIKVHDINDMKANVALYLAVAVWSGHKKSTKLLIEECDANLLESYDDSDMPIIMSCITHGLITEDDYEFLEWLYDSGYAKNVPADLAQNIFRFSVWDCAFSAAEKYATLCDFKKYPYPEGYFENYICENVSSKDNLIKQAELFIKYYDFSDEYKVKLRNKIITIILDEFEDDDMNISELVKIGLPDFTDEECRVIVKKAIRNNYSALFM